MTTIDTGKSNAKKAGGRVNPIAGFIVGRLDEQSVLTAASVEHIDTASLSLEQIAVQLHQRYDDAATKGKANLIRCEPPDGCLGMSPDSLSACPYCGAGDMAIEPDAAPEAHGVEVEATAQVAAEEPQGDQRPQTIPAPPPSEDDATAIDATEIEAAHPGTVGEPATKAKKKRAKGPVKHADEVVVEKALATTPKAHDGELLTEQTLDKAVEYIASELQHSGASYHRAGRALKEQVYGPELWKLRTRDGKPAYKSFEQFTVAEFGITPMRAYQFMKVCDKFTEEQVAKLGSKAILIVQSPEELQPMLIEAAQNGATASEIRKIKKAHGGDKPRKVTTASGKEITYAGGRGKVGSTDKAPKPKVTAIAMVGSHTVKLHKKPASMRGVEVSALPRAKRLADEPFGMLELENGVSLFVTIVDKGDGLVAKLVFKRDEE